MTKYLLGRCLASVPVLLGVSLFTFLLVRLVPGDPIQIMLGPDPSAGPGNRVEEIRRLYGLDRPWPVQYVEWLGTLATGSLGASLRTGLPVGEAIVQRLPVTLELTLLALVIGFVIGLPLAVLAAQKRGRWLDATLSALVLFGISMPGFWLGLLLIFALSLQIRLFPATGGGDLQHLVLPAVTLGLGAAAILARLTRSSMLEVLRQEYVTTARAKGLAEWSVILRHAMKNALIPVVTIFGLQFGQLLAGTVVVETVFARPGLGRLIIDGILNNCPFHTSPSPRDSRATRLPPSA